MKIDLNNYPNLSQTDRVLYHEISILTKQMFEMMDLVSRKIETMHNSPVEEGSSLARDQFKRGAHMVADSIIKFHLPRMTDRIEDIKLRRDLRLIVYSNIEKLRETL